MKTFRVQMEKEKTVRIGESRGKRRRLSGSRWWKKGMSEYS